jgi:Cu2+-exporting ATPase
MSASRAAAILSTAVLFVAGLILLVKVDMARGRADAVFLGDKLQPIIVALDISCKARSIMRQNLWLAAIYNAIAAPLAIAGHVTPLIAAAAMSISSILVIANALRAGPSRSFSLTSTQAAENSGALALGRMSS